jgi:acyl dehydratase
VSTETPTPPDVAFEGGAALPEWSTPELTRTHFVRYAGASGDFNPIHHDEVAARGLGYDSVFAPGMLTAGLLARYLTQLVGAGSLRRYRVRFSGQVWPGDVLTCRGSVEGGREEGGERRVDLALEVVNQAGDVVVSGAATAAVPRT